jgi:NDP-sugar pyrophosphorylase family protein
VVYLNHQRKKHPQKKGKNMTTFFSVYETTDPTLDTFRHIGTYRSFAEAEKVANKIIPPEYEKEIFPGVFFFKIRVIDKDDTIIKKVYIHKNVIV